MYNTMTLNTYQVSQVPQCDLPISYIKAMLDFFTIHMCALFRKVFCKVNPLFREEDIAYT